MLLYVLPIDASLLACSSETSEKVTPLASQDNPGYPGIGIVDWDKLSRLANFFLANNYVECEPEELECGI